MTACREVITYLECPLGYDITTSMEVDFLLGKVRKYLTHGANRFLSWSWEKLCCWNMYSKASLVTIFWSCLWKSQAMKNWIRYDEDSCEGKLGQKWQKIFGSMEGDHEEEEQGRAWHLALWGENQDSQDKMGGTAVEWSRLKMDSHCGLIHSACYVGRTGEKEEKEMMCDQSTISHTQSTHCQFPNYERIPKRMERSNNKARVPTSRASHPYAPHKWPATLIVHH